MKVCFMLVEMMLDITFLGGSDGTAIPRGPYRSLKLFRRVSNSLYRCLTPTTSRPTCFIMIL